MRSILVLLLLGACVPNATECSVSSCGVNSPPDNANTVCEPATECETLLCVGQGRGLGTGLVDQFCTEDCDPGVEGMCSDGFVCASVNLAGRTVCLKN
jgi:hypothetical protein